jgi:hypothetical protein
MKDDANPIDSKRSLVLTMLLAATVTTFGAPHSVARGSLQTAQESPLLPRGLGTIEAAKPAFLSIEDTRMASGRALFVSSFNPFGADSLSMIENIGETLTNISGAKLMKLGQMKWPNEARMAPAGFIADAAVQPDLIVVAGGFLVPGKATGAVHVVKPNGGEMFKITRDKKGFFYHRVEFIDMNGDGRLDLLTARANKPLFGASKGELLWLEQPASGALSSEWTEHVLGEGPDVHFRLADLDGNGTPEIVATEFFSKKLSLWWREGLGYSSRVVDAALGSAFDLEIVDVNADGRDDLLVTNHEADAKAAVFAYEIPVDMKAGTFTRHTLIEGIETRQRGPNQGSPGAATAFFPNTNDAQGKPYILVDGDGSQRSHLLVPTSNSATEWTYVEHEVVDAKSTVGGSAVGDVDGDGFAELFIPAYDKNLIHVFTFKP